jgi:hypothetical protein
MEADIITARILHFVFGVFWAGTAFFMAVILEPRLRALGPTVQRPVMVAIFPVMVPAMMLSGTVTIASGLYLLVNLWGGMDVFLDAEWGRAIFGGLIASTLAFASGITTSIQGKKMIRLGDSIQGRPPTSEEMADLMRLLSQLGLLGRTTAVLVLIAIVAMASARFL